MRVLNRRHQPAEISGLFSSFHRPRVVRRHSAHQSNTLRRFVNRLLVFIPICCGACKTSLGDSTLSRRSLHPTTASKAQEDDLSSESESLEKNSKSSTKPIKSPAPKNLLSKNITLTWRQPIDAKSLGISPTSKAVGQSIETIITSQVAGRDDGAPCGKCHNKQTPMGGYGLEMDSSETGKVLDPWAAVGTKAKYSWAGEDGWGMRFVRNKTKPESLKKVMQAWANSGFK